MSVQGIILIDLIALGLMAMIVNLVRTRKLFAGYAIVWLLALAALITIVSIPPLLAFVTIAVGAIFPASAVSLLAFVFIFLVLIFFSVQISILSSRQADLIQQIALNSLLHEEAHGKKGNQPSTDVDDRRGAP